MGLGAASDSAKGSDPDELVTLDKNAGFGVMAGDAGSDGACALLGITGDLSTGEQCASGESHTFTLQSGWGCGNSLWSQRGVATERGPVGSAFFTCPPQWSKIVKKSYLGRDRGTLLLGRDSMLLLLPLDKIGDQVLCLLMALEL